MVAMFQTIIGFGTATITRSGYNEVSRNGNNWSLSSKHSNRCCRVVRYKNNCYRPQRSARRTLCCRAPTVPRPEFSVICVGLGGAGKTTLLSVLAGEDIKNVEPTSGFLIKPVQLKDAILNVKEVGGGEKVRPFWKHYYKGVQAIVFVIDSASSEDSMEVAKNELENVLCNVTLRGLPVLVLANCQDKEGARNDQQMIEALELEDLCTDRRWNLHLCSYNDPDVVRDGFTKLSLHLLPSEVVESHEQKHSQKNSDLNRI